MMMELYICRLKIIMTDFILKRLVLRMNNFLYAMIESFNQMEKRLYKILKISQYTEKKSNELFLAVSSCLHSILDYA